MMEEFVSVSEGRVQLQATGKWMLASGLAWGNSGNISLRTGATRFLITASGTEMGDLSPDELVEYDFVQGKVVDGKRKPSKEVPMHQAVYDKRPDIGVVLHCSPIYSTLIACSKESVSNRLFVENMYYLERVVRVLYRHPGSMALGDEVAALADRADILLLQNHGVLVFGVNLKEAKMALQTLEMSCQMIVTARAANMQLNKLSTDEVNDFLQNSGYRPPRQRG